MGIRGFLSYITENGLTVQHRLHDTTLVIDGLNLENELYSKYLRERNDQAFGGDYTHFAAYIRTFFSALAQCNVTPVVLMDGSYHAGKVNTKIERFDRRLKTAVAIYDGRSTGGEEINSLLNAFVFVDVINSMGIKCYQGIYEADEIILQIGYDMACPILSGDSDFFVYDLPGGVVPLKPLVENKLRVNKGDGYFYLDCQLFKVDALQRKFTCLRAELIPLSGPILGSACLDYQQAKKLVSKMPRPPFRHDNFRQAQIYSVFAWLASQGSYDSTVAALKRMAGYQSPLIKFIQDRGQVGQLHKSCGDSNLSVDDYFSLNCSSLFKREPEVPAWAHDLLVNSKMKRLISIFCGHIEFFRPLVEDFSLNKSSYDCGLELCSYIYGLLRRSDQIIAPVACFVRQGYTRLDHRITPVIEIGSDQLPMLEDVGEMSEAERRDWFFRIIGIDQNFVEEIRKIVQEQEKITIDESKLNQLVTMIIATVYLSRHYTGEISIEFFYALLANIVLMGLFMKDQTDDDGHVVLLEFADATDHKALTDKLSQFDVVPNFRDTPYQARIVHLYNSFQNCLNNIHFLGQILNLFEQFHANQCFAGLQGTFIYNLASELANQDTPLEHLEKNILADQSEGKQHCLEMFSKLLDLVLNESARKYHIRGDQVAVDRAVVPQTIFINNSADSDRLFVRGFKSPSDED